MDKDQRDFKGVWIPKEVYLDKSVTWTAKVIFIEIHSFSADGKECFMSNEYLAEFTGITPTQVSRHISALKAKGWIELVSFDGNKRVLRSLKLCGFPQGGIDEKRKAGSKKSATPPKQKAQGGIDEKRKDTNTTTKTDTKTPKEIDPNAFALGEGDWKFFVDIYFKFFEEIFHRPPNFDDNGVSGKKLKSILKKLHHENKRTFKPWNQLRGGALLKHYFSLAITDKWLKENFELSNLDSKFNTIINKADPMIPKNSTPNTGLVRFPADIWTWSLSSTKSNFRTCPNFDN